MAAVGSDGALYASWTVNTAGQVQVTLAKHLRTKVAEAQKFVDWVTSPAGQTAIADYKINGEQLFFPERRSGGHLGRCRQIVMAARGARRQYDRFRQLASACRQAAGTRSRG